MKHRILIVEDNPIVLESLVNLLKRADYTVAAALDGPEALEWLEDKAPDCVLLDLNLPEPMTGMEVLARIREIPNAPPVIILTADGAVPHAVKAVKAGAVDYLVKPYPAKELKAVIAKAIESAKKKEEK